MPPGVVPCQENRRWMMQTLGDRLRASTRALRLRTYLPEVPTCSVLLCYDSKCNNLEKLMRCQVFASQSFRPPVLQLFELLQ